MAKSYKHIKPICQETLNGCWSASMAWWTKAMPSIPNWSDDEIKVEYSHLRGANGGLTFPTGFKQMLSDPKWGMTVGIVTSSSKALDQIEAGLKKGPVMLGFWDLSVGGHHAVVVHDLYRFSLYDDHRKGLKNTNVTIMDPNGGVHEKRDFMWNWGQGKDIIVGGLT
jgi:hypothetical protein